MGFTLLAGVKLQKMVDFESIDLSRLAERQLVNAREAETALLVRLEIYILLLIHSLPNIRLREQGKLTNSLPPSRLADILLLLSCRH